MTALPQGASEAERLASLEWTERWARLHALDEVTLMRMAYDWCFWRRDAQRWIVQDFVGSATYESSVLRGSVRLDDLYADSGV